MTKLQVLLSDKKMTQGDLQRAIKNKHGVLLGRDRISRLVSGIIHNYHTNTAKIIADTLEVTIDDILG